MNTVGSINTSRFASHFVLSLKLVTFAISNCRNHKDLAQIAAVLLRSYNPLQIQNLCKLI